MSNLHGMCRGLLSDVRKEAKKKGITIPKFYATYKHGGSNYEIKFKTKPCFNTSACCAYDARQRAITHFIELAED